MNEYIRREDAVKALGTIEICINLFEDSIEETAVAVDTYAQAADVVPWEWLKRYAHGRECKTPVHLFLKQRRHGKMRRN